MASHLYKDGHVTHNWEQMSFLQEIFNKEDALRAEVDFYGTSSANRSTMLDWKEIPTGRSAYSKQAIPTSRSNRSTTSRSSLSSRSYSSRSGYSSRSSGSTGSGYTSRSSGSSYSSRSRKSILTDRSWYSCGSQDSVSSEDVERLKNKRERLESQLAKLEEEIASMDGTARKDI